MLFHLFSFCLMITFSVLYGSNLGWKAVVGFWVAFFVATFVVGGVMHAPLLALLLRLAIALAMLVKGRMGSSSFS